ncbi:MAG: hypothetical protein ACRCWR_12715 [Saezia sp.]
MINEQEKQGCLLKSYQRKNTLKMVLILSLMLLLFALITWLIVTGRIGLSENVTVLFLYLFPVGISANTVGTWLKRRQRLAEMLKKEGKRLNDNPYGYGISSEVMQPQDPGHKKRVDHPILGAYWDELRFPSFVHGVVWMRCLYAGIGAVVFNVTFRFLGLGISAEQLTQLTWCVFAISCALILLANFLRVVRVYRYGIASYSLFGQEVVFFRDIFAVELDRNYASKGKIESMQLDLQCIGLDVRFYISDARQAFYDHFEKIAAVIHEASAFPLSELQKELAVTERYSLPIG